MKPEERMDRARSQSTIDLLSEAREAAHDDTEHWIEAHNAARENIKFIGGDQWSAEAKAERQQRKAPMLVFPKLNQFVDSVYGSMLQERPAFTVVPSDTLGRQAKVRGAKKRIAMAEARAGLMRQIDAVNRAQIAYLNAYEQALSSGFGHWRLRIDYQPYSFDKVILIEPVWDPFSVIWDSASTDIAHRDARRCWVFSVIPKSEFEALYPGAATGNFDPNTLTNYAQEWVRDKGIVIAEHFRARPKRQRICELSDGRVVTWDDNVEKIRDELAKLQGVTVARERQHEGREIVWSKIACHDVLEEELVVPGEHIPVVTCYGRRLFVDGRFCYRSLIEHAKDEQRAYNYARTRAIEAVALAPLSPHVIGSSQLKGYENLWAAANTSALAALPYDDTHNPNPPKRSTAATDLTGIRDVIVMSEQGLMSATGRYEAAQGMASNEKSGRAVLARAQQGDRVTEAFEENYRIALTQSATIVNDWLPIVYTNGMVAQMMGEDGTVEEFTVGREEIVDEQSGEAVVLNDLSAGRYWVKVDTAPEFQTRRQEAVQGLTEFAQAFPTVAPVLAPEAIRSSDFPNAERASRMAMALLPPEIREAAESDEDEELPPQVQAMVEQAQQAQQQAQAVVQQTADQIKMLEAEKQALESRLEAERVQAKTEKVAAEVRYDRRMLALEERVFALTQTLAKESLPAQAGGEAGADASQTA